MSEPIVYSAEQLWGSEQEQNEQPKGEFREREEYEHRLAADLKAFAASSSKRMEANDAEVRVRSAGIDDEDEDSDFYDRVAPTN